MHNTLYRISHLAPIWGILTLVVSVFLYGTTPDEVGPVGITIFFIAGYLFLAATIQMGYLILRRLGVVTGSKHNWKFSYALTLAFIPVAATGLESLDQLVLRDLLIFFALVALIVFYLGRSSTKK